MSFCFIILLISICVVWGQDKVLQGQNVCDREEVYNITVRVATQKPKIIKSYRFCLKVPPRCSKYETIFETVYNDEVVEKTRRVEECCIGYALSENKCVPVCKEGCLHGSCTSPDICTCQPGYQGPTCSQGCYPGICVAGGKCDFTAMCRADNFVGKAELCYALKYSGTIDRKFPTKINERNSVTKVQDLSEEQKMMYKSIENGNYTAIAALCSQGFDVNFADANHTTPLHLAVRKADVPTIMTILQCGMNINAIDENGNTPLHLALIESRYNAASSLLFSNADPNIYNRDGKTALQMVEESNDKWKKYVFQKDRLLWYLNAGPLKQRERKLLRVSENGYYGSAAELCMAGADARAVDVERKGYTALHVAMLSAYNVPLMVRTLVRCGADVNARDAEGNTPLHIAVMHGHANATVSLLQHRADPFVENVEGKTAYELATQSTDLAVKASLSNAQLIWYLNGV